MPLRSLTLVGGVVLAACAASGPDHGGTGERGDIYGDDDRREIYELAVDAPARRVADAVALMVFPERQEQYVVDESAGTVTAEDAPTLGEAVGLCPEEKYVDQPVLGECTAFLVAPDLVVTAGHCVPQGCDGMWFLFGVAYDEPPVDTVADLKIRTDDLYSCDEVVDYGPARSADVMGAVDPRDFDYAFIRLDRVVRDRVPVTLSARAPRHGELRSVVGHGAGLPQKASLDGTVRLMSTTRYQTNADIFGGNSGSPSFDEWGEVDGLVIHGIDPAYQDDTTRGCRTATTFLQAGFGTMVLRLSPAGVPRPGSPGGESDPI